MSTAAPERRRRKSPAAPADARAGVDAAAGTVPDDSLMDALPFALLEVTSELWVTRANREASRALGLPGELPAPLPSPWSSFSLRRFAGDICSTGALPTETRAVVEGGRVLELSGIPTGGRCAALVIRDVTVRAHEDEAERAFVANAAHELRASLGGIASAVDALELGAKEHRRERDHLLDGLAEEVRSLRAQVDALLVLARAQAAPRAIRVEAVPAASLVADVAATLAVAPGVRVETSCEPGTVVRAHAPLLEIALRNVARNAARHADRGTIVLACFPLDAERVALEVADEGPGIPGAVRERLFERFAAGEEGHGFGIGLPLTQEIVQLLDGHVDVESDPGGTRVRLVLPAA